jgi:hypothetical protein
VRLYVCMYVCMYREMDPVRCQSKNRLLNNKNTQKRGRPFGPRLSRLDSPLSLSLSETDLCCEWTTLRRDGWLAFRGSEERVVRRGNTLLLKVLTNAASSPNE